MYNKLIIILIINDNLSDTGKKIEDFWMLKNNGVARF
jgi:hypothetical protein